MAGYFRKRIILVDDVKFTLITTKDRLKNYYDVYPAQSAKDMYELLENMRPDLILLDINMPDVDGYEVLRKLKTDERYSDIPVIFLSSQSDRESVLKGISMGADAHVCKPFTVEGLIENIEHVLNP